VRDLPAVVCSHCGKNAYEAVDDDGLDRVFCSGCGMPESQCVCSVNAKLSYTCPRCGNRQRVLRSYTRYRKCSKCGFTERCGS
jgi:DNA-directed RNA polymerase subunit RPC12/RpoP